MAAAPIWPFSLLSSCAEVEVQNDLAVVIADCCVLRARWAGGPTARRGGRIHIEGCEWFLFSETPLSHNPMASQRLSRPVCLTLAVRKPNLVESTIGLHLRYAVGMEHFFTGLLILVALLISWFGFYVVYRLVLNDR